MQKNEPLTISFYPFPSNFLHDCSIAFAGYPSKLMLSYKHCLLVCFLNVSCYFCSFSNFCQFVKNIAGIFFSRFPWHRAPWRHNSHCYRDADKSLARAGRNQANVSVRTAWISFGALHCRQLASRCCWNRACPWHASELVSFLVGLTTYQHHSILSYKHHLLFCFLKVCGISAPSVNSVS